MLTLEVVRIKNKVRVQNKKDDDLVALVHLNERHSRSADIDRRCFANQLELFVDRYNRGDRTYLAKQAT